MNSRQQQEILEIRQYIGKTVDISKGKENFADIAKPILKVEIGLNKKFKILDFQSLLANNGKNNQTLSSLCEFLAEVETICVNFKKCIPQYSFIPVTHSVYLNMLEIKGGKELFQLIGYAEVDHRGLERFEENISDLMELLVDIIIARCELTEYLLDDHPHPHYILHTIKEFADSDHSCSICGIQQSIVICDICSLKSLCEKCDVTWHSHPKRVSHYRKKRNPVSQRYNMPLKPGKFKERLDNYISSSNPVEKHQASSNITEQQKQDPHISEQERLEASEMSIQNLKLVLIDLCHDINTTEKFEQKQTLRRKWDEFLNVFNKKIEDNIFKLTEHIRSVEQHIQILVMKDSDFYRRESYSQLNEDKIYTQKKISEMRNLQGHYSKVNSPEEFWLNYMQMPDIRQDENKGYYTVPFPGSAYNSDSDLYAKKSPQKHHSSTSTPEYLEMLSDDVAPPPDLEYPSTSLQQNMNKDFPIFSYFSLKPDPTQPTFDIGERKRSNTLSDISRPQGASTLLDSQNWVSKRRNGSQEESSLVYPSKREMPFVFREDLFQEQKGIYRINKETQMLCQEKLQKTEPACISKESSVDPVYEGILLNQAATAAAAAILSPAHDISKLDSSTGGLPFSTWNAYSLGKDTRKQSVSETMNELNEKKMLVEMQTKAGEVVRQLRLAEANDYEADVMLIALEKHEEYGMEPLEWIKNKWPDYISTVRALAVNKNVHGLLENDVANALKKHRGNVEKALDTAIKIHKKRLEQIKSFGVFSEDEIIHALEQHKGKTGSILEELFAPRLAEFHERIWQPGEEEKNESSLPQPLIDLLMNKDEDPERRVRAAFAEIPFKGWRRAEYVIKILDNHLENVDNCEVIDVVDVVQNSNSFENAVEQLTIVCNLCLNQFPQGKIMTLSFCNCKFCQECFLQNFKIRIREEPVRRWTCPTCSLPELNDEETVTNYFAFLNLQLKQVIDEDTFNLYETKLRDWHLHKDPNFRWCPSCENGFLYHADGLKMNCPHCNRATCFKCMKPWQDQHQRLSCEKFNEWLIANDPNNQAFGLKLILKKNGIVCPECQTPYFLAKGGCIHFTCKNCQHEFCAGCQKKFYQKEKCRKFNDCPTKGIHAHHPRDCLYYLRDEDVKTLQKLLKSKNVHYDVQPQTTQEDPQHCFIMVQKEINGNTLRDEKCGSDVPNGYAGLCLIHYKEYLVSLINQNKLDPVLIFSIDSLKQILSRNDRNIPEKGRGMSDKEYRSNLEELVKQTEHLAFGD